MATAASASAARPCRPTVAQLLLIAAIACCTVAAYNVEAASAEGSDVAVQEHQLTALQRSMLAETTTKTTAKARSRKRPTKKRPTKKRPTKNRPTKNRPTKKRPTKQATTAAPTEAPTAGEGGFTYGTQSGPSSWGGMCSAGQQQSPVNVPMAEVQAATEQPTEPIQFDYNSLINATVVNIHAIGVQVNVPPGNVLTTGGQKWELLQYHFHTPSEHSLDGRHAAMEAHLVHRNQATGALAVVGVLLEPETTITSAVFCSALEQALWLVPDASGASSAPHTLEADTFTGLIPGINGGSSTTLYPHVHYNGSLTTPPCTEGLSWYVLLKPSPVGAAQVIRFQRLLGNGLTLDTNARPVQPLRGRVFVH